MINNKKTIGLALGSGGVKGLAHIGVLKVLLKNNIKPDFITGSSIGAWVGAHYALFQDLKKLEELTVHKRKEKFASFIEANWRGGLVKGKKIQKLLDKWLEEKTFADLKIPFKCVATDLITGDPYIFESGNLATAVRASMAVPSIFKPVEFENKLLVDGGATDPVPTDQLKKMGADIIIAVNLDNYQGKFKKENPSIFDITSRSFDLLRENLAKSSCKFADIILKPEVGYLGFIGWKDYFTKDIGEKIVQAGEKETEKMLPKIKKLLK